MNILITYFALYSTIIIVWQTERCVSLERFAESYSCGRQNVQSPTVTVDREDAKKSYGILYDRRSTMDRKFVDEIDAFVESNLDAYNRIAYDYVIGNRVAIVGGSDSNSGALDEVIRVIGMDDKAGFLTSLTYPKPVNGKDVRAAGYDGLLFFVDLKKRKSSYGPRPVSYSYIKEGVERLCGSDCHRKGREEGIRDLDDGTETDLLEDDDDIDDVGGWSWGRGNGPAETFEERSEKTETELKKIMTNLDECSSKFRVYSNKYDRRPLINLDDLYDDLVDKTKHVHLELLNSIHRTTCHMQVNKHFIQQSQQDEISNGTVSNSDRKKNIQIKKDPSFSGKNSGTLISNENRADGVERSTRDFILEYLKIWIDRNLNTNNVLAFVSVLSDIYVLTMGTASVDLAKGVFHVLYRYCTSVDLTWVSVKQCVHHANVSVSYLRIFHGLSKRIIDKITVKWNTGASDNVHWKTMERNLIRMIEILTQSGHPKHTVAKVETMVKVLDIEYGTLLRPDEENDGVKLQMKCFIKSVTLIHQLLLALD